MPDLLVSSFFSNDLKKKRPLTCGWVKKPLKNGHKNLRYRWKPIQLRLGLHKKTPIDGVSTKDPRFLGGNLLICLLVKSVNVSISINLRN